MLVKSHTAALLLGLALGVSASWQIAETAHRPADAPASYSKQSRRDLASVVRAVQREARTDPHYRKPR